MDIGTSCTDELSFFSVHLALFINTVNRIAVQTTTNVLKIVNAGLSCVNVDSKIMPMNISVISTLIILTMRVAIA